MWDEQVLFISGCGMLACCLYEWLDIKRHPIKYNKLDVFSNLLFCIVGIGAISLSVRPSELLSELRVLLIIVAFWIALVGKIVGAKKRKK